MQAYAVLMSVYAKADAAQFQMAVESMLQQTVPPAEFVLVCDGPVTGELDKVIAELTGEFPDLFRIIRLPENRGLGIALQEGLLACSHELVARMDADDLALPQRMERQLSVMEHQADLAVLGGQIGEFIRHPHQIIGYRQVPTDSEQIRTWAKSRCPINHMTALMRRSQVLAAGGYQHFPLLEDYHLWARMLNRGCRFANLPEVCCKVRVDERFYVRRGGRKYFRQILKLEMFFLSTEFITKTQFLKNIVLRFAVTVMVPAGLRRGIYHSFLRKRSLERKEKGDTNAENSHCGNGTLQSAHDLPVL